LSANQTLGDNSGPFECDSNERTHTLLTPGGVLHNIDKSGGGGADAYVDFDAGTVTAADGGSIPIPPGGHVPIPHTCKSFTAKTASGNTYLQRFK